MAASATNLPPGTTILPGGAVISTGAPATVATDPVTGTTTVMIGDPAAPLVLPPGITLPPTPPGEPPGKVVVTPDGVFYEGANGEKVQIAPPPPTHAVLSPAQQARVKENFKKRLEEARVVQVIFNLDSVDFDALEKKPQEMISLTNTLEEAFENLTKGDATITLEPRTAGAAASAFLGGHAEVITSPSGSKLAMEHASSPEGLVLARLTDSGGKKGHQKKVTTATKCVAFITAASNWDVLDDTSAGSPLFASITGAVTNVFPDAAPPKMVGVASTDPHGPGGVASSEDLQGMYKFSQSEHMDWSAVEEHRNYVKKEYPKFKCTDEGWVDNDNRGCDSYGGNNWCQFGRVVNVHKVVAHKADNDHGGDECCQCGGGIMRNPLANNINKMVPLAIGEDGLQPIEVKLDASVQVAAAVVNGTLFAQINSRGAVSPTLAPWLNERLERLSGANSSEESHLASRHLRENADTAPVG